MNHASKDTKIEISQPVAGKGPCTAWMVYNDLKDHANIEVDPPPFVERYLSVVDEDNRRELMGCLSFGHEGRMSFDDAILLCEKIAKRENEEYARLFPSGAINYSA
jgi:hypothetical protein